MARPLNDRLIEQLYTEAMLLADETRSNFDRPATPGLPPLLRVEVACEALKGTTRLMQVIAWLLERRAPDGGANRLGDAPGVDLRVLGSMPDRDRRLLMQGVELYERVRRMDDGIEGVIAIPSPARSLLERLERSL